MLTGLSIRDFVLIDQLDLTFEEGLSVLTGETGAGKSIILDALGMACGARMEVGCIRPPADKASVTAHFSLQPTHLLFSFLKENDLDVLADEDVIIRRVINKDGRSKAYINDQPVSITLLREAGTFLVEVHGQFETHGLLDTATHRPALDRFANIDTLPTEKAYADWQTALNAELEAQKKLHEAAQEQERLQETLEDLTRLAPEQGEEDRLQEQRQTLAGHEKLSFALSQSLNALQSDTGAEQALIEAARTLSKIEPLERITQTLAQLDLARDAVANAQSLLESLAHDIDRPPLSLEQVEDRLYALRSAARRYGTPVDELSALSEKISHQLSLIDQGESFLHTLAATTLQAKAHYEKIAGNLSALRQKSAKKLETALQKELPPLKMDRAQFHIALLACAPSAMGLETVQFEVSTNPGMPMGPLHRIASGGELARFMLALKVILAQTGEATTLIFDEVDQGVGGAVAAAVGDRLAKLGTMLQVFVVTHSPQVAAKGAHHFKISKTIAQKVTRTVVQQLSLTQRREEIARMLAGETITDSSRQAASELLAM